MDNEKLARVFVSVADTLVDDFDVVDLLFNLVTRSVDLFGASAAGLLLSDEDGVLRVASASSAGARVLELFQIQHQEGPCLDCFRSGRPVRTERLDHEVTRWPTFASVAREQGFVGVLALPMRLRGQVIGALNLLSEHSSLPIAPDEIPLAQALADVATIAIMQDRLARSRELLAEQLQAALNSRVVIEQAKGALATRLGIDQDAAFALIRARSRSRRRKLVDVAEEVISTDPDGDWGRFRQLR
ncbi:GAF and ANTAR domain-containing protein [Nocardioides sp.]|uniref:GAF and ANTAR domain-containing protein n=1 Tax=Nocardioides sp. TaxID=35761 RepID=UPI002D7F0BA9|nr:GAF and ANTAR domain-containing protein [Nocardioides sp.]HET8959649.1 GAF and ANTAR domain-containing protein [Nocardioides sp.]